MEIRVGTGICMGTGWEYGEERGQVHGCDRDRHRNWDGYRDGFRIGTGTGIGMGIGSGKA